MRITLNYVKDTKQYAHYTGGQDKGFIVTVYAPFAAVPDKPPTIEVEVPDARAAQQG